MNPVIIFDIIFFLASLTALIVLLKGWKRAFERNVKFLLSGLLVFSMFYSFCLVMEWSGITKAFEPFEDLIGALVPMWWAFIFYAFLQEVAGFDLRESERRLSTLMGNLPGMPYRCINDENRTMEFVSDGCFQLTGHKSFDLIGNAIKSYSQLIHPEDRNAVWDEVQQALAGKRPFRAMYRIITASGEEKWVWEQGVGVFSDDGVALALEGFITDITERKRAEEDLLREKTFSDTVINSIPGAFFVRDEEGKLIRWSKKNEAMTGYSGSELSQMEPTALVVEEEKEFMAQKICEAFTKGEAAGEINFIVKSGKKIAAYFTALRMTIDKKRYLVGTVIDITELKQAQEALQKAHGELEEKVAERTKELAQANIRLQELDRLKSMFLASMSHELRTPLNSIIGFVSWLLMGMEGELNEEQNKQLTMVKNSANHLLSLINDILDISKIESGKVDLSIEEFAIDEVTKEVVETVLPQTKEKGLALLVDVPEGIQLKSDKRRVKQVLMNLVSNAVKFTDQGDIKITGTRSNRSDLEIIVADSGIGIREEDMEKLFQAFEQIDMSSTKKHEGTGLGLYLCKKLMGFLGGTISAESQYGKGSEFTFKFPLEWHEEG